MSSTHSHSADDHHGADDHGGGGHSQTRSSLPPKREESDGKTVWLVGLVLAVVVLGAICVLLLIANANKDRELSTERSAPPAKVEEVVQAPPVTEPVVEEVPKAETPDAAPKAQPDLGGMERRLGGKIDKLGSDVKSLTGRVDALEQRGGPPVALLVPPPAHPQPAPQAFAKGGTVTEFTFRNGVMVEGQ